MNPRNATGGPRRRSKCRCCRSWHECSRPTPQNQTCVRLAWRDPDIGVGGVAELDELQRCNSAQDGVLVPHVSGSDRRALSVVCSSVLLVRYASLKCSCFEHTS